MNNYTDVRNKVNTINDNDIHLHVNYITSYMYMYDVK